MHGPKYIVASGGARWRILHGGPRHLGSYPTKTEAVSAAIALAKNESDAEVLVQHEDGYVLTEWVQGQDEPARKAARPITPPQGGDLRADEPDEIGPQGGYGGCGEDQDHPKR